MINHTFKELDKLQKRYFRLNFPMDSLLEKLEKTVVGQTEGIKTLLFACYNNQYLNLLEELSAVHTPIKRVHTLVIGPTGVGKTKAITKIAELFNVPFVKFNATQLTASGYVGSDVNMILSALLSAANEDLETAQRGIIFIDEIDKKVSTEARNTAGRDINGTAVQEELMKLLEPSVIYLGSDQVEFDTHALTIVAGGRFYGLDEIRKERLRGAKSMGFSSPKSNEELINQETTYIPEDLIKFGFLDEFVGRFGNISEFHQLNFDSALDVIYAEDSILNQYLQVFESKGVTVYIDPINFTKIAEEISQSKTGARYLELKIFKLLEPLLYQVEQHFVPGVCEIDYNGNYYWMFDDSTCNF